MKTWACGVLSEQDGYSQEKVVVGAKTAAEQMGMRGWRPPVGPWSANKPDIELWCCNGKWPYSEQILGPPYIYELVSAVVLSPFVAHANGAHL